jgi:hypothetical protein
MFRILGKNIATGIIRELLESFQFILTFTDFLIFGSRFLAAHLSALHNCKNFGRAKKGNNVKNSSL